MTQNKKTFLAKDTSAKDSAERVLSLLSTSDTPGTLVQALAPHDYLLTWRLADDEQRADLLRLADKSQADLLIDISCWSSDIPDVDLLEEIVGPLASSGVGGAIHVLGTLENELKTLLFRRNVRVHLLENRNDEIEVPETSELLPCPDGLYFIEFPDPDLVSDVERALWQALLLLPFEQYQPELECVRHDLASELQETALRWRVARLADLGFASREEALALLTPRSPDQARRLAAEADETGVTFATSPTLPALYKENLLGNDFLDEVLAVVFSSTQPEMERRATSIASEISSMINRFLTASAVDISDLEKVALGARNARDMIALGLTETARGDITAGAKLLATLNPGVFVQVGLGLVYPLRDRARSLLANPALRSSGRPDAIFDPPHRLTLTFLSREVPCHWPQLDDQIESMSDFFVPSEDEIAAFSSREQVARAENLLREAEHLPTLLFDSLRCETPLPPETPASMLVLTALANAAHDRAPRPLAITPGEARHFVEQALALEKDRFVEESISVLAPLSGVAQEGCTAPEDEPEPDRRLLLRLVRFGRDRLASATPEQALLIEPV